MTTAPAIHRPIFNSSTPILVIGPSGIGKSTLFSLIEHRFPACRFMNLDLIVADLAFRRGIIKESVPSVLLGHLGSDRFLEFGIQAMGVAADQSDGKRLIVDVGAGFQTSHAACSLHKLHPMINIAAEPEAAYQRFTTYRASRARQEFLGCEFSGHRRKVYNSAHIQIDSTRLSPEETADALAAAIREFHPAN